MPNIFWLLLTVAILSSLALLSWVLAIIFLLALVVCEWLFRAPRYNTQAKQLYLCLYHAMPWYSKLGLVFGFSAHAIELVLGPKGSGKTQLLSFANPVVIDNFPAKLYKKNNRFYIIPQIVEGEEPSQTIKTILSSLKPMKTIFPLQTVIMTLSADQIQNSQSASTVKLFTQQVQFYKNHWPWLSFQLMITQSDKLYGFKETCAHLPYAIKKTPLGILFPYQDLKQDYEQLFNQHMDYLCNQVQSLNSQATTLAQTLQALKPKLQHIITLLAHYSSVKAIFFSSTRYSPPLFVNDWLKQSHQPHPIRQNKKSMFRLLWLSLILIGSYFQLSIDLQQELIFTQKLHHYLPEEGDSTIKQLEQLHKARQQQSTKNLLATVSTPLREAIDQRYETILKNEFKNELKQELETALENLSSESIKDFSTYLDFCADEIKHPDKIIAWFNQGAKGSLDDVKIRHMQSLLTRNFTCETNKSLVSQVSSYIESIPNEKLIVLLTKNAFSKDYPQQHFFSIASQSLILNTLLAKSFQDIAHFEQNPMSQKDLEQARKVYLGMYRDFWNQELLKLTQEVKNLEDIDQALLLWQTPQHFPEKLQEILTNIDGSQQTDEFNIEVTQEVLSHGVNANDCLKKVHDWVEEFALFVKPLHDNNTNLHQTQYRFAHYPDDPLSKNNASIKHLPEKIQKPLLQLSQATWEIMVKNSQTTIEEHWLEVSSKKHKDLFSLYPLRHEAEKEMDIKTFEAHFGPKGSLQTFINNTIAPFLDDSKKKWKTIDSVALFKNKQLIDWINAMQVMQTMLFDANGHANNTWTLNLEKVAKESDSELIFEQDEQKTTVDQSPATLVFHIPDLISSVTITHRSEAQSLIKHYTGNWAWLRALETAQIKKLKTEQNKRTLDVRFDSHNDNFHITAITSVNNALTSGLFKKIRPPETIS